MTIRVVVADDHAPLRLGVRAVLEADGFVVVAEAASARTAVGAAVEHRPDVILLDVHMPGGGIAAARAISEQVPQAAVVMLTMAADDQTLFEALRAGARGYLLKDIDPARLPHALRGVLEGKAAVPRSLVTSLVDEFRSRDRAAPPQRGGMLAKLTSREWEVLDLMRQGLSTQEIAEHLFVAPVTVRTHVAAILRKLHVGDRDAAVRAIDGK